MVNRKLEGVHRFSNSVSEFLGPFEGPCNMRHVLVDWWSFIIICYIHLIIKYHLWAKTIDPSHYYSVTTQRRGYGFEFYAVLNEHVQAPVFGKTISTNTRLNHLHRGVQQFQMDCQK